MMKPAIFVLSVLACGAASAQAPADKPAPKWTARTPDGQPDLQGIWTNNSATPFERPAELAGRATLTDAEVRELQKSASELFNGETDAGFGDAVFKAALQRAKGSEADIKKTNGFDVVTGNYNQYNAVFKTNSTSAPFVGNFVYARDFYLMPSALDRKSTRLNSSH